MNKGGRRNVYALRGTPFVLVKGFRCYTQAEESRAKAGARLVCSKPEVTDDGITVTVYVGSGKTMSSETFGGTFDSDRVEAP